MNFSMDPRDAVPGMHNDSKRINTEVIQIKFLYKISLSIFYPLSVIYSFYKYKYNYE